MTYRAIRIPHYIRGCAKDAYHFWLRTGKDTWSYGSIYCLVSSDEVLVVEGERAWIVPVGKTWN